MKLNLKKLASELYLKWADEIPPTLRSGLVPEPVDLEMANTERLSPVTEDIDISAPSLLDVNRHTRKPFSKDKNHLYIILNLMYRSGLITPGYYKASLGQLDTGDDDTSRLFLDFVDIIHRAELEAEKYIKNLHTLKGLVRKNN